MKTLTKMKRMAEILGLTCFVVLVIIGLVTVLRGMPISSALAQGPAAERATATEPQNIVETSAIPKVFNYQGILRLQPGNSLANGAYNMTFRLYDQPTGGNKLHEESITGVVVRDGIFNVVLGSSVAFDDSDFANAPRYLGITVGNDQEMQPRQQIHAGALGLAGDDACTECESSRFPPYRRRCHLR